MMRKMMSPPNLPVDRSQDCIKEDDLVQVQEENACDFEEEIFLDDYIYFVFLDRVLPYLIAIFNCRPEMPKQRSR